jgi:hypothetical protein
MDIIEPATESGGVCNDVICQWKLTDIVMKRGAAILAWQHVFQEAKPFFHLITPCSKIRCCHEMKKTPA